MSQWDVRKSGALLMPKEHCRKTLYLLKQATFHFPFPSNRHHWSNGDCLEGKREKKNLVVVVVVVVKCIYKPYVFSHSVAASSPECNRCSPFQLGLWAAVDNMCHCLAFATRAHVGCCKAALLSTGCALALVGPETIRECPVEPTDVSEQNSR